MRSTEDAVEPGKTYFFPAKKKSEMTQDTPLTSADPKGGSELSHSFSQSSSFADPRSPPYVYKDMPLIIQVCVE